MCKQVTHCTWFQLMSNLKEPEKLTEHRHAPHIQSCSVNNKLLQACLVSVTQLVTCLCCCLVDSVPPQHRLQATIVKLSSTHLTVVTGKAHKAHKARPHHARATRTKQARLSCQCSSRPWMYG